MYINLKCYFALFSFYIKPYKDTEFYELQKLTNENDSKTVGFLYVYKNNKYEKKIII